MAALLQTVAEDAQNIGSALHTFLRPVAEYAADITALIAQCFAVSSALLKLGEAIEDCQYPRRHELILGDLATVRSSLVYTIKDVKIIFGGLGTATVTQRIAHRQVWRELKEHFHAESGNSLRRRFEYYQHVLHGLTETLIEGTPRELDEFEEDRDRIYRLLGFQDDRLADQLYHTSLEVSYIQKPPSFERERPGPGQAAPQPQSPLPTTHEAGGTRAAGPRSPPMEGDQRPPFAPEVPQSPTSSTSNTLPSSQSSRTSSLSDHWLPKVFEQSQPTTLLDTAGQTSTCFGPDLGSEASKRLADGYEKVLEMPFENGDLLVQLHQRQKDFKARFLCRTIRPVRSSKVCCLPLTSLEVERDGPFLRFIRISDPRRPRQLWALLKFFSYEKLVLFFCSFLALRSEETPNPLRTILDSRLRKEEELYGGRIVDDYYEHGLRMYRDENSGAIRLQASVMRGDLKRIPVWTAFITHQVQSPTWMMKASPKVIHLADLQRYIFTDDYNPQTATTGEHELAFKTVDDLKAFTKAVRDLR